MDIKCLGDAEYGAKLMSDGYFKDLVPPSFLYSQYDIPGVTSFKTITVEPWHEMRIDLLFTDMYQLEPNAAFDYLSNVDVILALNNIDNPLNIKPGMVLRYPSTLNALDDLRLRPGDLQMERKENSLLPKLVVPNKSTRKDSGREKFKEGGYSLPPTILAVPKEPVRILKDGGVISAGGL